MKVEDYIQSLRHLPIDEINSQIEQVCGIADFFTEIGDIDMCLSTERTNKDEYGDWQTNSQLANKIALQISKDYSPQVLLEPTCGRGNFILAALDTFTSLEEIYAIEIYKPYLQILKQEILQRYLDGTYSKKICFHLLHCSVFEVDWKEIRQQIGNKNLLVLGNPPWVTNSDLSKIDSKNLPHKSNFKQVSGLSAMTGKGNFDIAEYICYDLFRQFANGQNQFALLLKNSVIKQICHSQQKMRLPIAQLRQYKIDAKKEFGASVDASLFTCKAGDSEDTCEVYNFYTGNYERRFGWTNQKFVSNMETYARTASIDGISPFQWWSGIKHDCQPVVELTKRKDGYYNKLGELVNIEEDCIYPYAKSSDIQGYVTADHDRYVIITQHKVSDNTEQLQYTAPRTYNYLMQHRQYFDKRKSSIYKNRSPFCMFGIGDYTFKPYKVVVSSLYKNSHFTLLTPINGKCVIPDDTCYQLGFDNEQDAQMVLSVLSSLLVKEFLDSISFSDSKRMITKDLLMRINLIKAEREVEMSSNYFSNLSTIIAEPLLFSM